MKRLTKKYKNMYIADLQGVSGHCFQSKETVADMHIYKKLGKLEDIEEQLGIPLLILFKVLFQHDGYYKDENDKIYEAEFGPLYLDNGDRSMTVEYPIADYTPRTVSSVDLKEYKKTWALTKKDLE